MGDTSALSPPSPSALSYFDALQQVSSFDKVNLRGLTPLPLGWGLTTSEFRPPHVIIHDGGMIEQLLQNLRTTLQGIDGPTPSSLASVELDVWGRCMLDNSAWERRSMSLCRATTNVTNNISELLLNRAILDSNDVSVPSLSPAPSPPCTFRSLQGSEHHRWSHYEDTQELTSTKTGLILHVKSVTDTKLLDTALPYLLDFGKDQVIVTGLGQRIPAPNPFGVLQLIAHHFGASSATWLVLTSSIHSMILRLYQAHNGERIILCSDLIHMKQSHLLLPALISLQLSPINNKLDVHLPLGPKFEPLRVIQDRKNRRLEVENSDAVRR
ncbi:hypothetical protein CALCODRAFT_142940 [Calocera cornea HHB12733]|uniref:Uncharacterized protein n=1 Tax=Calocera cornea HHB12733 TaxID=1353952 RepID=A0A165I6E8_9BASI|nr:hypothetical protein CALCODRAFT_142940 [Calocera cornea HHB12733]